MIIIKQKDTIKLKKVFKDEAELKDYLNQLVLKYQDDYILCDESFDNHQYGYIHLPSHKTYELYYYNDYDDYEDEIEIGCKRWFKDISNNQITDQEIDDFLEK